MADNKPKQIKLITPRGLAIYPNINRPDKKYPKNGYPVYGAKLLLERDAVGLDAFVKACEELRDEAFAAKVEELKAKKEGAKAKSLKAVDILRPQIDKETGEETGKFTISARLVSGGKTKDGREFTQKPDVIDSKGTVLKNPPIIYGGSTLKLGVFAFVYYAAKENEIGVSFRLKAAQIIKLGEKRADFNWGAGEEDGYVGGNDDGAPQSDFGDESGAEGGGESAAPAGENPDF
jgi:hypothetical protein